MDFNGSRQLTPSPRHQGQRSVADEDLDRAGVNNDLKNLSSIDKRQVISHSDDTPNSSQEDPSCSFSFTVMSTRTCDRDDATSEQNTDTQSDEEIQIVYETIDRSGDESTPLNSTENGDVAPESEDEQGQEISIIKPQRRPTAFGRFPKLPRRPHRVLRINAPVPPPRPRGRPNKDSLRKYQNDPAHVAYRAALEKYEAERTNIIHRRSSAKVWHEANLPHRDQPSRRAKTSSNLGEKLQSVSSAENISELKKRSISKAKSTSGNRREGLTSKRRPAKSLSRRAKSIAKNTEKLRHSRYRGTQRRSVTPENWSLASSSPHYTTSPISTRPSSSAASSRVRLLPPRDEPFQGDEMTNRKVAKWNFEKCEAKDGKLGIRVPQHETEKIRSWNQTKNLSPSQQDSIAMFNAEFETQLREAMHALIESAFMKEQFETENVTLQVREGDNVAELQVPLFVKSKRLKCIDPERVINTIWSGLRDSILNVDFLPVPDPPAIINSQANDG